MGARRDNVVETVDGCACGFLAWLFPPTETRLKPIMPMDESTGIISSRLEDIEIPDCFAHDFILRQVQEDFDPDRLFEVNESIAKMAQICV